MLLITIYFSKIFANKIYLILLFIIDISGILNLNNQNIVRRLINMSRRIDFINYEKYWNLIFFKYKDMIDKDDLSKLQSINIPKQKDSSFFTFFTRRGTTSHQFPINYSKQEIKIINQIREKIKKRYERKIVKKLYLLYDKNTSIYRYYGKKSYHLWHVDPINRSDIYNVILCIRKKGKISHLEFKNNDNKVNIVYLEEWDAALFCGGSTVHQVPPNNDEKSERTVLSIPFTTDQKLSKYSNISKNLCTYLQGGNNILNIGKIYISIFLINLILTQISGIYLLSYKFLGLY